MLKNIQDKQLTAIFLALALHVFIFTILYYQFTHKNNAQHNISNTDTHSQSSNNKSLTAPHVDQTTTAIGTDALSSANSTSKMTTSVSHIKEDKTPPTPPESMEAAVSSATQTVPAPTAPTAPPATPPTSATATTSNTTNTTTAPIVAQTTQTNHPQSITDAPLPSSPAYANAPATNMQNTNHDVNANNSIQEQALMSMDIPASQRPAHLDSSATITSLAPIKAEAEALNDQLSHAISAVAKRNQQKIETTHQHLTTSSIEVNKTQPIDTVVQVNKQVGSEHMEQ
ncbi:hypothetical protein [Psychrobacter sp. I-STPA10]|uniref:hypothetical protein n=1 Tax=Psychrobacter sp. I-STPA10 TaxID=2585769 RepID=UPI001E637E0A|nr:hypothetical protein [Psychrobacter sp. I-STPA10]